jgi:hypothetical protein
MHNSLGTVKALYLLNFVLVSDLAGCHARSAGSPITDPPAGYEYAVVMPDCAPWDALALTLYLTPTPSESEPIAPPFLRVSVYSSPSTMPGRAFRWTDSTSEVGAASRCLSASACVPARAAQVRFGPMRRDSTLGGVVDLRFPDARPCEAAFKRSGADRPLFVGSVGWRLRLTMPGTA